MRLACARCGTSFFRTASHVNRSRKAGAPLYCGRTCMGMARRVERSKAERVARKAAYDAEYRATNAALLKAKKAAYFQATYDPAKAAVERKAKMARHVEYCRSPEYRAWKREYDRVYRAKVDFGPFWEAAVLLLQIEEEVSSRMTRYEVYAANGTINKTQRRKREYENSVGYRP